MADREEPRRRPGNRGGARHPGAWSRTLISSAGPYAPCRKTRILAVLLGASALLAFVPPTHGAHAECKTIEGDIYVCGEVSNGVCGAGSGQATAPVSWRLVVDTNHGDAEATAFGPAAALRATAPCWTDTCTTVSRYANDEHIVSSMTLCT